MSSQASSGLFLPKLPLTVQFPGNCLYESVRVMAVAIGLGQEHCHELMCDTEATWTLLAFVSTQSSGGRPLRSSPEGGEPHVRKRVVDVAHIWDTAPSHEWLENGYDPNMQDLSILPYRRFLVERSTQLLSIDSRNKAAQKALVQQPGDTCPKLYPSLSGSAGYSRFANRTLCRIVLASFSSLSQERRPLI